MGMSDDGVLAVSQHYHIFVWPRYLVFVTTLTNLSDGTAQLSCVKAEFRLHDDIPFINSPHADNLTTK